MGASVSYPWMAPTSEFASRHSSIRNGWFSHKFNGPGLRYEVGLCIQTGDCVWIHGPFPCGTWPDLRIARDAIVDALDDGECYLADGGETKTASLPLDSMTSLIGNSQQ